MKILLVAPTHKYKTEYPAFLSASDFPSGIAYIASALTQAGHEVFGLNPNNITGYASAKEMITAEINNAIDQCNPDMIGLGGLCIDFAFLRDAINIIRDKTDKPIVLGGRIVTNDPKFIKKTLNPDYIITDDAERRMVALANGQRYRSKPLDIDSLPFPDFDSFGMKDMLDNYSSATRVLYRYTRPNPRPMIIVTARGCPFACTFCCNDRTVYQPRSIRNIFKEIDENYMKYKFNVLIIQDELFAVNDERMRNFCNALIAYKDNTGADFDWMMQTHANARLAKETMELAKKSGCYLFSYGVESASPTVLKSMKKHINPDKIAEAIKTAGEVGIGFGANLIFGDPAETEDTIRETMAFYYKYGLPCCLFLGFIQPYPGSAVFDYCIEKGIIKDKLHYYEHIDEGIMNMTSMTPSLWITWAQHLNATENSYLMLNSTNAYNTSKCEAVDEVALHLGLNTYNVYANCPYCGHANHYREMLDDKMDETFVVTGCQSCNKRVRINIRGLHGVA